MASLLTGCGSPAENVDWAMQLSTDTEPNGSDEIQEVLDTYAQSLVDKDRDAFLSIIDQENPEFLAQQQQLYDRLEDVPFQEYNITLTSKSQSSPGTFIAKVAAAYTLAGSFTDLPDPDRAAYYFLNRGDGWKLSGDASEAAFGKPRDAVLEDFGKIEVLEGDHSIVLYHPGEESTAANVRDFADASYPQLEETLPGIDLPKVPIRIFDNQDQINLAFPGKWQEWTGGASRALGPDDGQGGEIIIGASLYRETGGAAPDYNRKMLAHEMTHVALFPQTGSRTPPFLVEGLADYVGGIDPIVLLPDKLRSGEDFSPRLSDLYQPGGFSVLLTTEAATLAYEEADMAVEYLESTYGNEQVFLLLREFKRRSDEEIDQDELVNQTFRSVLGISWNEFESAWESYVLQR